MFGWFKRKPRWVDEPDEIYRTRARADAALVETARSSELPVIVASFFALSLERIEAELDAAGVAFQRLLFGAGADPALRPQIWTLDASRIAQQYAFDGWLLGTGEAYSFLFVEHHPLASEERVLLDVLDETSKVRPQRVRFFVGLDEPLMLRFGADRIVQLMDRLGIGAGDVIRHPLVDRAIRRAQDKLRRDAPSALPASSAEEWFELNLPGAVRA
jgi:hypothetical protein